MLCSIDDYPLADGTLAGGYALAAFSSNVVRVMDIVAPIGALNPQIVDRTTRETAIDFQVTRFHDSLEDAETFVADHDALVPSSGTVAFTADDGSLRYLLNASLITHARLGEIGRTTTHAYHIIGGIVHTAPHFYLLLEDGDYLLLESGDKIRLEHD